MSNRKLPKLVEEDSPAESLTRFIAHAMPTARLDAALIATLRSTHRARRLVRGIDAATQTLKDEQRGQTLVDQRTGSQRGVRISRVLFVASDGSTGFYRQVENLADRHEGRLLVIRLDVNAAGLGTPLYGPDSQVRALLVTHKDAVAAALLALVPQLTSG